MLNENIQIDPCNTKVSPDNNSVAVTASDFDIDSNVNSSKSQYQFLCSTCNNNVYGTNTNNCRSCYQDHNDPRIEPRRCQQAQARILNQPPPVAWGETSPMFNEPYDIILCTCDITNVFCHNYSDNSDNYYVYLHKNIHQKPPGFYLLKKCCLTGHMALYKSNYSHAGPLWALSTLQLGIVFAVTQYDCVDMLRAKMARDNYKQDCDYWDKYGITYESHMDKIIEHLLNLQHDCTTVDMTNTLREVVHPEMDNETPPNKVTLLSDPKLTRVVCRDVNDSNKTRGYIAMEPTNFSFTGPDRATESVININQYLRIAKIIRHSGLPNYRQVRIPIKSGLNIEAWKSHLKDYPDQKLIQYLQYGFPLSIENPQLLGNKEVKNHFSALQHPAAIEEYLAKERSHGAILGPIKATCSEPIHAVIHCSPLLTRAKDIDKRRVILDLSYPQGSSLNDQVDKLAFDNSKFLLKFPSIDDIVQELGLHGDDVTIAKIDVARAFRNLRVDPADAVKLGIKWKDDVFVDVSVAFGWVHGSVSFQRVSDAVTYIMSQSGAKMFAYIDDYILISPKCHSEQHFQRLASLLAELGLPSNPEKQTPPCRKLTCLGIQIDLDANTLSIHPGKLHAIYAECLATSNKRQLTKRAFQSLLGKLLYIHKCVQPARTFINRMLALLRQNPTAKKITLTSEFHKDLNWFLAFLPSFNGITYISKPEIFDGHSLQIDASLTGLGGIWNQEVYTTPIFDLYGFELKIVHLEMLNLVIALRLWSQKWAHCTVKFYCDNSAVVQVVRTGKTRDQMLALCLRNIWLIAATHDIHIEIDHIQGIHNNKADLLSRLYSDKPVDHKLLRELENTCTWHRIPIQFFNLNYNI